MISYFLLFSYVLKKYMTLSCIFFYGQELHLHCVNWNDRWGRYCHSLLPEEIENSCDCFSTNKEEYPRISSCIFIFFGDDLKFCHIDPGRQRSLTWSTSLSLADNLGLANVLASCFHFSATRVNPNSLLFTESMQWESLALTVLQYVEESLCAPQTLKAWFQPFTDYD